MPLLVGSLLRRYRRRIPRCCPGDGGDYRRPDGPGRERKALLGYALSMSRLPQEFGAWLTGTLNSKIAYLLMVNLILLIVGCFMEAIQPC